jgi:hypothetical protein
LLLEIECSTYGQRIGIAGSERLKIPPILDELASGGSRRWDFRVLWSA